MVTAGVILFPESLVAPDYGLCYCKQEECVLDEGAPGGKKVHFAPQMLRIKPRQVPEGTQNWVGIAFVPQIFVTIMIFSLK